MAELATIARPYAEALFKSVAQDITSAAAWVDELGTVTQDAQLQQFANSPKVSTDQVFDVVTSVARSVTTDQAKNFLRTVIDNGRLNVLPEIAAQFRALKNAQGGTSDALVYSAFPLSDTVLAEVAVMLEKRFGRRLNAQLMLEPELIGGIRVVVGDEVLDTSVKARLEQMKVALTA